MSEESLSRKTITLGLIGCGWRLRGIIRWLLDAAPRGSIRVVAAYDTNKQALSELREILQYDVRAVDSEEALVQSADVDWIFIGSPNSHHARQIQASLYAGKDVFCEKPLATTVEDCLSIRDAVNATGRTFSFGLVLRYAPHYQTIRRILDSGALGQLVSFEFNETLAFNHGGYIFSDWRRHTAVSGGHMLEKCCHDLDLANWFADSVPVKVASFGGRNFFNPENASRMEELGCGPNGLFAYQDWSQFSSVPTEANPFTGGADIMDNQVVVLEYANGIRATFHANCNAAIPERRIYLLGTNGALRADLVTDKIEIRRVGWGNEIENVPTEASDHHGGGDTMMARALARTLLNGEKPLASVQEGLTAALTALAIDESCRDSQVIDLSERWLHAGIDLNVGL